MTYNRFTTRPKRKPNCGWLQTNSKRWYYVPSNAEIRRQCALIRERWDRGTLIERRERVAI